MPTVPSAAAVCSDATVAPRNTPCCQSNARVTSGTFVARRPPNTIASTGTPAGSCHVSAMLGHCAAATVNREFGCAAGRPESGVHDRPVQSVRCAGGSGVRPSHHTSPSSVRATLVKMTSRSSIRTAVGLVSTPVPGATPKKPASGLMAYSRPSSPGRSHAMSSPSVSTRHPGRVGWSIAKFVLPHAEGNAAATWYRLPSGEVTRTSSMCSASQPSSRPITDAMRSAKHFLPSSALPPYPDPNDQISRDSGKCATYLRGLHGHGTSATRVPSDETSGAPTLCTAGTQAAPARMRSTTSPVTRVMTPMLTTTYGESVSCTPNRASGLSTGPIENGTT